MARDLLRLAGGWVVGFVLAGVSLFAWSSAPPRDPRAALAEDGGGAAVDACSNELASARRQAHEACDRRLTEWGGAAPASWSIDQASAERMARDQLLDALEACGTDDLPWALVCDEPPCLGVVRVDRNDVSGGDLWGCSTAEGISTGFDGDLVTMSLPQPGDGAKTGAEGQRRASVRLQRVRERAADGEWP